MDSPPVRIMRPESPRQITKPVAAYAAFGRSGVTGASVWGRETAVRYSKRREPVVRVEGAGSAPADVTRNLERTLGSLREGA